MKNARNIVGVMPKTQMKTNRQVYILSTKSKHKFEKKDENNRAQINIAQLSL